jgi:hypothetical protein
MPANQKTFQEINREEYDVFVAQARAKGWTPPYGDSGYLRGPGMMAEMHFSEKEEELHIKVRELGKDTTYPAFFREVQDILVKIDR